MNKKARIILLIVILVAAAGILTAVKISSARKSREVKEWMLKTQRYKDAAKKIPDFNGKTEEEVIAIQGQPHSQGEWKPFDGLPELFIDLHEIYPYQSPESKGVIIKAFFWEYPDINLAVAFHKENGKWIVLKTYKWPIWVIYYPDFARTHKEKD